MCNQPHLREKISWEKPREYGDACGIASRCSARFCRQPSCHLTLLLNMRSFIFGLTSFGWLCPIMLTPRFYLRLPFRNTNRAQNKGWVYNGTTMKCYLLDPKRRFNILKALAITHKKTTFTTLFGNVSVSMKI
jgi:hypothetical protein